MLAGKELFLRALLVGMFWLAGVPAGWCTRPEDRNVLQLREVVEINHSPLFLSDLLPREASPAIRNASAGIVLCPAPRPRSIRILLAAEVMRKMAQHPLLLRLAVPARITIRYSGSPIEYEAVRSAITAFLREKGWQPQSLEKATLEWPASFWTSEERSPLHVTAMQWDYRRQALQLALRCASRMACGNFLVRVASPKPLAQGQQRSLSTSHTTHSSPGAAEPDSSAVLVTRGRPATLVLRTGTMRISVPVISIEPGRLHQQIRVYGRQPRRVFRAEVVAAGLLQADL